MGKTENVRLASFNRNLFDKENWQTFTAVIKYNEDLTVWAATTLVNGEDKKKFNLFWLLGRNHQGPGRRDKMDMDICLFFDPITHRNCHSKLYGQLY